VISCLRPPCRSMGQHAYSLRVPKGLSPDTGFAGFRPWYPVLQDGVYEEFVAYLGASYFRAQGLGEPHKVVRRRFREGGR
jgi:glucan biosynthesis protein